MPALKSISDHYARHDEIVAFQKAAAKAFPRLCRTTEIGRSHEGRPLLVTEITNRETGPGEEKPAYWIDGNTHASELAGSAVACHTIHELLTRYGKEAEVTHLLDTRVFYILPRVSPDGAEYVLRTGIYIRSSTRPYPFDDLKDGLHPEDMNGDGDVLQMRVRDPLGEWKISPRDPRLMVKRRPDERGGIYYRLYREGRFENWDGRTIAVAPSRYGLDMNRQYPHDWRPHPDQHGAGPYPLSEPESRAVVEFLTSHRNVTGVQTYHTFSAVILRPLSNLPDDKFPNFDRAAYRTLGERATEITGYPCKSVYHDFRYDVNEAIHGVFDDWCYEHLGVFAFTTELWSPAGPAGIKVADFIKFLRDRSEEDELRLLRWNDRELKGKGFARWKRFRHPQLGEVEIGGWRALFTWSNPPLKYLRELCERHHRFTLAHAAAAPRLRIREFSATTLGPGLHKIVLSVENEGYLPTNVTQKALDRKIVRPIEVSLELAKGQSLEIGKRRVELGQLGGAATTLCDDGSAPAFFDGSDRDAGKTLEWGVRGDGPISVTVRSDRAGTVRASCKLPSPRKRVS